MSHLRPAGPRGSPGAAGAVDEARQQPAQALQTGQAFRRAIPVTTKLVSGPAPLCGLQSSGNLGPFKDRAKRDVWIDRFPIVEQVSLVRVAGGVGRLMTRISPRR